MSDPIAQPVLSEVGANEEFPYRAISRAAILSIGLFVLSLPGLMPTFEVVLALSFFGAAAGIYGISTVRKYPNEYGGGLIAQIGLMLNTLLLVGGVTMHAYIYFTEVPDGYERIGFYELQMPEQYPDSPTQRAADLDGKDIFLKGYIHPASGSGLLSRFVLVPDLGTCCFGGEPRSSSMIEVTMPRGQSIQSGLLRIKLAGRFELNKYLQTTGDFENPVYYRLKADQVK